MLNFKSKIIPPDYLHLWRETQHCLLVVTNGCFDLLHLGHVSYLEGARNLGEKLLVGINDDASVRKLKGPGRPVQPAEERASIVAALECVDFVYIFEGPRAHGFLFFARPVIWVKGADYTLETLDQDERHVVERTGAVIKFIPFVAGHSTSRILASLQSSAPDNRAQTPAGQSSS